MYTIISNDPKVIELARANGDKVLITNSDQSHAVDNNLNIMVTSFLTKTLNIPAHINGFLFIKTIFMKSLEVPGFERNHITKTIYPYCAKIYNTTPERVERNVRHAIEKGFERSGTEEYRELFGNIPDAPTNKCFIMTVIQYFKEHYLQ